MTNLGLGDKIKALRAQGLSYKSIQAELGCARSTVSYHLGAGVKSKNIAVSAAHRAARVARITEIKESQPCADCGNFYEHYLMDFDHLPEFLKVGEITKLVRQRSWAIVEAELLKCEVVCCMCHRRRTHRRNRS